MELTNRKSSAGSDNGGWEKSVLRTIHHSETPIAGLVDDLMNEFSASFLPGELVNFSVKHEGKRIKGEVTERNVVQLTESAFKEIKNTAVNNANTKCVQDRKVLFIYDVKLDKENKVICKVPACDLQRFGNIPSRKTLRNFIQDCAMFDVSPASKSGDKCWMVKEDLLKRHLLLEDENVVVPVIEKATPVKKIVKNTKVKQTVKSKKAVEAVPAKTMKMTTLDVMFSKTKRIEVTPDPPSVNQIEIIDSPAKRELKNTPRKGKESSNASTGSSDQEVSHKSSPEKLKNVQIKNKTAVPTVSAGKTLSKTSTKTLVTLKGKKAKESNPTKFKKVAAKRKQVVALSDTDIDKAPKKKRRMTDKTEPTKDEDCVPDGSSGTKILSPEIESRPEQVKRGSKVLPIEVLDNPQKVVDMQPQVLSKKGMNATADNSSTKPNAAKRKKNKLCHVPSKESGKEKEVSPASKKMRQTTLFNFGKTISVRLSKIDNNNPVSANKAEIVQPSNKRETKKQETTKSRIKKKDRIDSSLVITNRHDLPVPCPVVVPEGFPLYKFGDVIMIVEFLILHKDKLSVRLPSDVKIDHFLKSLVQVHDLGYTYYGECFVALLGALLKDIDNKEFGVPLSQVRVDLFNAADMVTLLLRAPENGDNALATDAYVPSPQILDIVGQLRSKEIFELCVGDIVALLSELVDQALATGFMRDIIHNCQQSVGVIRRKIFSASSKLKELKKDAALVSQAFAQLQMNDLEDNKNKTTVQGLTQRQAEAKKNETMHQKEQLKLEKEIQVERMNNARQCDLRKVEKVDSIVRKKCLGEDRNQARYWIFSTHTPGLYIETGWTNCGNYSCQAKEETKEMNKSEPSIDADHSDNCGNTTCQQEARWFVYPDCASVDRLIAALSHTYPMEEKLKRKLEEHYSYIVILYSKFQMSLVDQSCYLPSTILAHKPTVLVLKQKLLETEEKITAAMIGCKIDRSAWQAQTESCESCHDLALQLVSLFDIIFPRYLIGPLAPKRIGQSGEYGESVQLQNWKKAAFDSTSVSRLHNLLKMLVATVAWESAPSKVRCKVCGQRNKGDIVLCEGCSTGFHIQCLRPKLAKVPDMWHCPSCKSKESGEPLTRSSRNAIKSVYKETNSSEDEDEEKSEEEDYESETEQAKCTVCKGKSDSLIMCCTCDNEYHQKCIGLKYPPRGFWKCKRCR